MLSFIFAVLSLLQLGGGDPCHHSAAEYPPPPLPPCAGLYNVDCLTICNYNYSNAMANANIDYCVKVDLAFDNFDISAALCQARYDICISHGGNPDVCESRLEDCLNNATEKLANTLSNLEAGLASAENAAQSQFFACAIGCCVGPR